MSMPLNDEPSFERWRGQVDAFMAQSLSDRGLLHQLIDRANENASSRHRELLDAIEKGNAANALAIKTLTEAINVERARIDRWEARAEGAGWTAKWLPHSLTAAASAFATFVLSGHWPTKP
jgi:hypothetical protein